MTNHDTNGLRKDLYPLLASVQAPLDGAWKWTVEELFRRHHFLLLPLLRLTQPLNEDTHDAQSAHQHVDREASGCAGTVRPCLLTIGDLISECQRAIVLTNAASTEEARDARARLRTRVDDRPASPFRAAPWGAHSTVWVDNGPRHLSRARLRLIGPRIAGRDDHKNE